jgi:hypothetical protein
MSTKSTLASGPNFQLYTDLFDHAGVYLEMAGVKFESSNDWVKVAIPFPIWEVVRQYAAVDLSMADKTDKEIWQMVESEVDHRIKRYAQAKEHEKSLVSMAGSLVYGAADTSREEQIVNGLDYYTELRERQSKIKLGILELQRLQRQSEGS